MKPIDGIVYDLYKCPNCGNSKINIVEYKKYRKNKCKNCGFKWKKEYKVVD